MPPPHRHETPAKFYQEDLVRQLAHPHNVAIVLRCWHDSEEVPPMINQHADPLLRPLKRGEVGVSYLPTGKREIAPEDNYTLIDRVFHSGDVCKRSVNDVRCGIVIDVEVSARIFHAINGLAVPEPVSHHKLKSSVDYFIGDFVLCDDWVGQIEEVFEENTVHVGNGGQLVRVPQLGPAFGVGDRGPDIIPNQPQSLLSYLARTLRQNTSSANDVVINVVPTVLAITWLAINQRLSNEEAAKRQRPQRFWTSADLARLVMVHNRSEEVVRVGERVQFKDVKDAEAAGVVPTEHGKAGDGPGLVKVYDHVVSETRTKVKVIWQDGVIDESFSTDLVPYLNVDESEVWPGDHVLWKFEDEQRVGVVQTADAYQRTATVRWYASPQTSKVAPEAVEVVSALELDPHGHSADQNDNSGNAEMFGVRRGEFVFIHNDNETNGLELPRVPKIGEVEAWVREAGGYDDELQGWRKEMFDLGWRLAASDEPDANMPRQADPNSVDWFGEVTELRTDGLIEVTLPNFTKVVVPLERLTLLQDGLDQTVEDMWGDEYDDEAEDEDGDEDMQIEYDDPADADAASEGSWETVPEEDRVEWVEEQDSMDVDESLPDPMAPIPILAQEPESVPAPVSTTVSPPLLSPPLTTSDGTPAQLRTPSPAPAAASSSRIPQPTRQSILAGSEDDAAWQRFAVLSSAPVDHAFYATPVVQPSKSFTTRLAKEFRVLSNNLPETILVRSYEDRSDLMRSMIIGPENTPYEDAPFVIDWLLDADFPQTPPKAHFLSWTNGNGRVNPNLYEEGKVCLSILGTWAGDAAESWSAAKSSLFQVFLSIQGLVLVKEPWFCEPAYEKLRGTVEGTVNSRLYSERAYVLSRGFIRRALEIPLSGLEEEIQWLYYKRGMLEKVLEDARALIEKSKDATDEPEQISTSEAEELAIPRLTAGGVITLSRTLTKLQALLDTYTTSQSAITQ